MMGEGIRPVTERVPPAVLTIAVDIRTGAISTATTLGSGADPLLQARVLIGALNQVKAALEERRIELEVANKLQATEQPAKEEDHAAQDHDAVAAAVQLDGADAA